MICLNAKKVVFAIKIIELNNKLSIKKIIVVLIFKINDSSIYIAMTLINKDIIILL